MERTVTARLTPNFLELEIVPPLESMSAEDLPKAVFHGSNGDQEVQPIIETNEDASIVRLQTYVFATKKPDEETIEGYSARVARSVGAGTLYLGDLLTSEL